VKILTTIFDIVTIFLRVLEGEGRLLRRSVMRLGWVLVLIAMASLLVLTAAGFLLLGLYQSLISQVSPVAAALLVSLLASILALIFAGIAKWRTC